MNRIEIKLNNDMTRIIEQAEKGFVTYTVMGTDNDIDINNIIGEKTYIDEQELFEFTLHPTKEEVYRQVQHSYFTDDIVNNAKDMNIDLSTDEAEFLAEKYEDELDANQAQNDQMKAIISEYVQSNGHPEAKTLLEKTEEYYVISTHMNFDATVLVSCNEVADEASAMDLVSDAVTTTQIDLLNREADCFEKSSGRISLTKKEAAGYEILHKEDVYPDERND